MPLYATSVPPTMIGPGQSRFDQAGPSGVKAWPPRSTGWP